MPCSEKEIAAIYLVLRKHYGVPETRLNPDLSINRDVGIDGDDAGEFLEFLTLEIGREVSIDFAQYFYGEGLIQFGRRQNLTVNALAGLIGRKAM